MILTVLCFLSGAATGAAVVGAVSRLNARRTDDLILRSHADRIDVMYKAAMQELAIQEKSATERVKALYAVLNQAVHAAPVRVVVPDASEDPKTFN